MIILFPVISCIQAPAPTIENIIQRMSDGTLLSGINSETSRSFGCVKYRMSPTINNFVDIHVNTAILKWIYAIQYR